MLRAQQLAAKDATSDKGFAMLVTTVITILLFSLLGAYLTMTNLSKSAAAAYVDGNNTFYAAESGLNKRASIIRAKFDGYSTPTGLSPGQLVATTPVTAASIALCFNIAAGLPLANDFGCGNYAYQSQSSDSVDLDRKSGSSNSNSDYGGNFTLTNKTKTNTFTSYTFVADTTQYQLDTAGNRTSSPFPKELPSSDIYGGLNVIEYKYTVYATAAKNPPVDPANPTALPVVSASDAKTVLQLDFRTQIIPLFQFAAFYDGDLEINSTSNLNLAGRVHTNSNFYVQPNTGDTTVSTTFANNITVAGKIYNRVDASPGFRASGSVRLELKAPNTFLTLPPYVAAMKDPLNLSGPLSTSDLSIPANTLTIPNQTITFQSRLKDGTSNVVPLTTPAAGFLRKRNYYKSATATNSADQQAAVGAYWAKADMRLEMVPDRDAVEANGTPLTAASGAAAIANQAAWRRDEAIIPFNFTSIQAGAGPNLCSITPPATNTDPAPTYVDPGRNGAVDPITGAVTIRCNRFTKGQLQSLRQPVMVLTAINQTDTSISDHNNPAIAGSESKTLGKPALAAMPVPPVLIGTANNNVTKTKIIRALQVAIASTPKPLALELMGVKFDVNDASDISGYGGTNAGLFKAEFDRLISPANFAELNPAQLTALRVALLAASPNQIAALRDAWFLPAPIQRLTSSFETNRTTGARTNHNLRSSGFYDGRERRWITMLQTNIKSLTVWNRDGLFVEADVDPVTSVENLRQPYLTTDTLKNAAFNNSTLTATPTSLTNNNAFIRGAATTETLGLDVLGNPNPFASLKRLGLGSSDTTEGGLVFHATVSDDLNGDDDSTDVSRYDLDGTRVANNVTPADAPVPRQKLPNSTDIKYYKNADGTNKLDSTGNSIPYTLDYLRSYWGSPVSQSPFGFAFSGGDFLPGAMTIATDQAAYIQGDFNNNSAPQTVVTVPLVIVPPNPNRLPASILADTITILSNQCNATNSAASDVNHLGVQPGQELGIRSNQIRCGLPRAATGSANIAGTAPPTAAAPTPAPVVATFYLVTAPTAVNAAFLSYTDQSKGNCTTTAGVSTCGVGPLRFSGALNNYIRMLEEWNGGYYNYTGSFVSLGTPVEYSQRYLSSGTYFGIPSRNFNYDRKFDSFNLLPPLTPQAQYLRQEVFRRTFN